MNDEIKNLFEENKIKDLKNFLSRRHFLNKWNTNMIYLFHIIQTVGILATSISASTNNQTLLWVGISLNMTASIIQVYEKINYQQMKRILVDIESIKNNTYTDESTFVDPEEGVTSATLQQNSKQNNTSLQLIDKIPDQNNILSSLTVPLLNKIVDNSTVNDISLNLLN